MIGRAELTLSGLTEVLNLKNESFVSATLSAFPWRDGHIDIGNEIITHRSLVSIEWLGPVITVSAGPNDLPVTFEVDRRIGVRAALRLHLNLNCMRLGHCAVNPFGLAGGMVSPAGSVPEHPIRVVVAEMLS